MRLHPDQGRVAVVGAGPAGLTAAKHLLEHGLEPLVLERSDDLGGQWHAGAPHSGVWPGMRTNTSRTLTAFSDLPPAPGPMFPRAEQVHAYLRAYAECSGVADRLRTGAHVTHVGRAGDGGWTVRWTHAGAEHEERFAGVVLATGRYGRPRSPAIPGLDPAGDAPRVSHAAAYRGRDAFRGRRVLVYGNSISGLEIATDLGADHTIGVVSACRRPRYVIPKVHRGAPVDWRWFSRFGVLLGAALGPEAMAAGMREAVLAEAGDPVHAGGLAVDPHGPPPLSMSQEYLAQLADGRIAARPAVERFEGRVARFADGSSAVVDDVVLATGYELHLPFLDPAVRRVLGDDDEHLDLHARTWHPDLPGLAVLGQFLLVGPYFPAVELQARWVAGVWSGAVPAPAPAHMREAIAAHRAVREARPVDLYHLLTAELAAELGVEPDLTARPELAEVLLFGPLAPARWRLDGPGARPDAATRLRAAAADLGPRPAPDPHRLGALQMVASALGDPALAAVAARLGPAPEAVAA